MGTGEAMGLITERNGAANGYAAVTIPGAPGEAVDPGAQAAVAGDATLHRRSALPSRRCVLYLLCRQDSLAGEDLVTWYTERGLHFYVADLRPPDPPGEADGQSRHGPRLAECFTRLDAACAQLREAGGIDMIILSGHSAGALTAALWCDARRDPGPVDALILSRPATGRRLRRGLDIACPVLVMSAPRQARGGRLAVGARRRDDGASRLGPHVTWLQLGSGPAGDGPAAGAPGADADRRRMFDELGRWLGAYMYGHLRDQLL